MRVSVFLATVEYRYNVCVGKRHIGISASIQVLFCPIFLIILHSMLLKGIKNGGPCFVEIRGT